MRHQEDDFHYSTDAEIDRFDAVLRAELNEGMTEHAWILSDRDCWYPNPFYSGPPQRHPEDYDYEDSLEPQDAIIIPWENKHLDAIRWELNDQWSQCWLEKEMKMFCPSCGKQEVHTDTVEAIKWDNGEYGLLSVFKCHDCGEIFYR